MMLKNVRIPVVILFNQGDYCETFIFNFVLLLLSNTVANAYCPTAEEFQAKSRYFQSKAISMMSSQSSDLNAAEALLDEQSRYLIHYSLIVCSILELCKNRIAAD